MNKITKTSDMTPGILYCLFTHEVDGRTDEPYDLYGALVYWTGEGLMYEDGDDCHAYWDYAVAQSTTPNADFCIEADQIEDDAQPYVHDIHGRDAQRADAFDAIL